MGFFPALPTVARAHNFLHGNKENTAARGDTDARFLAGFTDIAEEKLSPVVGFVNRYSDSQAVSINFGIEPFRYAPANATTSDTPSEASTAASPEIFVNKTALAEREKINTPGAFHIPTASWPAIKADMEKEKEKESAVAAAHCTQLLKASGDIVWAQIRLIRELDITSTL